MSNDNIKRDDKIRDSSSPRIKPLKRPSAGSDNPLVKMLDSIISGLEHSTGKRTYLCGNPDCGTLIIFHSNEPRPVNMVLDVGLRSTGKANTFPGLKCVLNVTRNMILPQITVNFIIQRFH